MGDDAKSYMHEVFAESRAEGPILVRDEHLWTGERISQRLNEREYDSYKQLAALLGLIGETLELIPEETIKNSWETTLLDPTLVKSSTSYHIVV